MKRLRFILPILLIASFASCEDPEVLHTAVYPIMQVEPVTVIAEDPPKEDPPAKEENPSEEQTQQAATTKPNPDTINLDVLATAPVRIGGSYILDFTLIDQGTLTVDTALAVGVQTGTFVKELGKNTLRLIYGERDYTCTIGSYTENGAVKVLLTIDLTKHYQELYPDWNITSVVRKEYTSVPYK